MNLFHRCLCCYYPNVHVKVLLDLDADTVAFLKNGEAVGLPRRVVHQPYRFAFYVKSVGDAVAIVRMD